jgi:hypothetical protein
MLLMLKVAIFNGPPHAKRPFCPDPSVTLQVLRLRRTRFEDEAGIAVECCLIEPQLALRLADITGSWFILQVCVRSRDRPRKQNARQYLLARMRSPVGGEHLLKKHVVVLTKIY